MNTYDTNLTEVDNYIEDLKTRIEELIDKYRQTGSIAQIEVLTEVLLML